MGSSLLVYSVWPDMEGRFTRLKGLICLAVVMVAWTAQAKVLNRASLVAPQINVVFSPNEDVPAVIVRSLNAAQKQVLVQAYLLTDNVIARALVAAHRRKVDVRVLLDAERARESSGSDAYALMQAGIPVKLETAYDNAHNKVIVIDAGLPNATLLTGSYNFTRTAATKNAENLLIIRNAPALLARYVDNWRQHDQQASPLR